MILLHRSVPGHDLEGSTGSPVECDALARPPGRKGCRRRRLCRVDGRATGGLRGWRWRSGDACRSAGPAGWAQTVHERDGRRRSCSGRGLRPPIAQREGVGAETGPGAGAGVAAGSCGR